MTKRSRLQVEGTIRQVFVGDQYDVELDNAVRVNAYLSGRLRIHHIKLLLGDRVVVELSPYDLTKGRVIRRL